jgi:hypothetical protein
MPTFSRICGGVLAAAGVLTLTGCLRSEVTHTIYVSPSGVVWSAMEKDVRSDEADAAKGVAEEHDYVLAARTEQQPIAASLRRLGARPVTTTWLRRERPYTVVTEGRFADLRQLVVAMLRDAGLDGDASLVKDGCRTTFTVRINLDAGTSADGETALDALLADPDAYRVVLTQGRFVSADGFMIEPDGAVATLDANKSPVDGVVTMRVAWTDGGC